MRLDAALQLILVMIPKWDAVQGQMQCYERESTASVFSSIGDPIPIVVGQKGMAWGVGLHSFDSNRDLHLKREGDLKSPAGVFEIGPLFADRRFVKANFLMPVLAVDDFWEAVDDPNSIYYNQIVDLRSIPRSWQSSEQMRRQDNLYHLGLVIQHNPIPAIPGYGSCIFMHTWRQSDLGTHGCTALAFDDLERILLWLNPEKFPIIVQLPLEEFQKRQKEWPFLEGLANILDL